MIKKLGTTVATHEELSKILRETDSITSALTSVIESVAQTTIIGQDVRHRLDEVASRRDVTEIHRKLDGVGIRIRQIEAHITTNFDSHTPNYEDLYHPMWGDPVLPPGAPINLSHLAVTAFF